MAGRQSQCKQASHITTLRMRTPPQCRLQHSSQPMHAKQHNSQRLRPVCTPQHTNTELGLCGRESSRCHTLSKQPAWHPTHTEDTGFRAHQHDIVCKHRLHDTVCAAFLVAVWPYQCTTQLLCCCACAQLHMAGTSPTRYMLHKTLHSQVRSAGISNTSSTTCTRIRAPRLLQNAKQGESRGWQVCCGLWGRCASCPCLSWRAAGAVGGAAAGPAAPAT